MTTFRKQLEDLAKNLDGITNATVKSEISKFLAADKKNNFTENQLKAFFVDANTGAFIKNALLEFKSPKDVAQIYASLGIGTTPAPAPAAGTGAPTNPPAAPEAQDWTKTLFGAGGAAAMALLFGKKDPMEIIKWVVGGGAAGFGLDALTKDGADGKNPLSHLGDTLKNSGIMDWFKENPVMGISATAGIGYFLYTLFNKGLGGAFATIPMMIGVALVGWVAEHFLSQASQGKGVEFAGNLIGGPAAGAGASTGTPATINAADLPTPAATVVRT